MRFEQNRSKDLLDLFQLETTRTMLDFVFGVLARSDNFKQNCSNDIRPFVDPDPPALPKPQLQRLARGELSSTACFHPGMEPV